MKKSGKGKLYTFVLNVGYVEHQMLSSVAFSTRASGATFSTARHALIDLADFFKEHFLLKNKSYLKACCDRQRTNDPDTQFCGKCGQSIKEDAFDGDLYADFIHSICTSDVDSFHGDCIDWDDTQRWQHEDMASVFLRKGPEVRFVNEAEKVLVTAIGFPPQDRTLEDIFKSRTKSGGKVFSYWGD